MRKTAFATRPFYPSLPIITLANANTSSAPSSARSASGSAPSTSASAHTAGPWFVDRQSPYTRLCIKPYPGRTVCDLEGVDPEAEANARLIAAAPDLLDVCKRLRDDPNMDDVTAVQLLSSVIDKAEGGQDRLYCDTCGSEIVETVNDSLFKEGECNGCEYQRYHSHLYRTEKADDLRHLADRALDAFWDVVADAFPDPATGDLSPECTIGLRRAAEAAVKQWVTNNVPERRHG